MDSGIALRAADYRNKAEELLIIAAGLSSDDARATFRRMADDYIRTAESLERMSEPHLPQSRRN
jgi:hypothetical protein